MAITLKSQREIELMRGAGSVVAKVLLKLNEVARAGQTTAELNEIALQMTLEAGAEPLFKGVEHPAGKMPFPGAICSSINEQVVHGIPSQDVYLKEGDILSVDFGVRLNGYCGDSAITIPIGQISSDNQRLIDVTREVLDIAVRRCGPGVKWSSVAGEMQQHAKSAGFGVVTEYAGHGIGRDMHEPPRVPNFVSPDLLRNDFILKPGMVVAIEPMINAGSSRVKTLKDGWTVVTKDGRCSAHFEHTVAITKNGNEVLTRP